MLIKENLKNTKDLSSSEKAVADYLVNAGVEIKKMSTSDVAKKAYTSAATVVRLAKKMGFSGWNEMKEKLLDEIEYMCSHFSEIDANYPFQKGDTFMEIANKLATLETETINDTISLLDYQVIHYAIHYLSKANTIYIFGTSVSLILGEKFKYKMARIGRRVSVNMIHSEQLYEMAQIQKGDAAIILSYSGEDQFLIEIAESLQEKHVDVVSVTNVGVNTIQKMSKYNLFCSTREKLNEKIAAYSSIDSMDFILDLVYSGIFSLNYDENLAIRYRLARHLEKHRKSNTEELYDDISLQIENE